MVDHLTIEPTYTIEQVASMIADYRSKGMDAGVLHQLLATMQREAKLRSLIEVALKLKGGWREAIVELEDHCSEPVRLRNMIAAADGLDFWAQEARRLLAVNDGPPNEYPVTDPSAGASTADLFETLGMPREEAESADRELNAVIRREQLRYENK